VPPGLVRTFYIHPSDVGVAKAGRDDLAGGDAADNAAITRRVLEGEAGPRRDIVLLNAGVALLVAGRVSTVREGIAVAARALDAGAAGLVLERLVRESTAAGEAA
jgi:anthranilate phosphoribosyltransferase